MTLRILILFMLVNTTIFSQSETSSTSNEEFIAFLESSLRAPTVNKEMSTTFFKTSRAYWKNRKLDYFSNPTKYENVMPLYYKNQEKFKQEKDIKSDRIESVLETFQKFDERDKLPKNPILFVGSSSIAGWKTAISFPSLPVINRGIGGMSMQQINYYYTSLIKKYMPSMVVVYCDIDIENGKSPKAAMVAYKQLTSKIISDFPSVPIVLLSMKPAMIDDILGKDIRKNKMLFNNQLLTYGKSQENIHFIDLSTPMLKPDGTLNPDIFLSDGMHLNELGYAIWNPIVSAKISALAAKK